MARRRTMCVEWCVHRRCGHWSELESGGHRRGRRELLTQTTMKFRPLGALVTRQLKRMWHPKRGLSSKFCHQAYRLPVRPARCYHAALVRLLLLPSQRHYPSLILLEREREDFGPRVSGWWRIKSHKISFTHFRVHKVYDDLIDIQPS